MLYVNHVASGCMPEYYTDCAELLQLRILFTSGN